ncbi:MAG TPA: hypothetical protein VNA27_14305 [Rubrobacteraceae bacterium]|nr:hypothetical protein [Rubrobacteraceae bacterium]
MERFGTRLMALDDWGDNSHEGELLKYMKGWVSKGERLKIAERRLRGKLRKAREGRTIGGALQPRYRFKYVRNAEGKAVGYEVDPKKMGNVRMIFEMLAGAKACVLYRRSSSRAAF